MFILSSKIGAENTEKCNVHSIILKYFFYINERQPSSSGEYWLTLGIGHWLIFNEPVQIYELKSNKFIKMHRYILSINNWCMKCKESQFDSQTKIYILYILLLYYILVCIV